MSGTLGGLRAALYDQRHGLIGEPVLGDVLAAAHAPEHRAGMDAGGVEPGADRTDRAEVLTADPRTGPAESEKRCHAAGSSQNARMATGREAAGSATGCDGF